MQPLGETLVGRSWCLSGRVRDTHERLVVTTITERWSGEITAGDRSLGTDEPDRARSDHHRQIAMSEVPRAAKRGYAEIKTSDPDTVG